MLLAGIILVCYNEKAYIDTYNDIEEARESCIHLTCNTSYNMHKYVPKLCV